MCTHLPMKVAGKVVYYTVAVPALMICYAGFMALGAIGLMKGK